MKLLALNGWHLKMTTDSHTHMNTDPPIYTHIYTHVQTLLQSIDNGYTYTYV